MSMRVYYLTFAFVILFGLLAEKADQPQIIGDDQIRIIHSKNTLFWYCLLCCLLVGVSGFRYRVGTDYGAYFSRYQSYIDELPIVLRNLDEPGFGILAWVGAQFYNNGAAAIFISSLVTVSLPLIIIYNHTDKLLFSALIYLTCCWVVGFNAVRQCLAASVLFCGYGFLKGRNPIKYLLIVFLAFLCHRSAVVMVILYFVSRNKVTWRNIILLLVVTAIILVSYDRLLLLAGEIMDKSYSFDDAYTSTSVNRIRVIAAIVPAAIFLFFYRNRDLNDTETFLLNLTILHAAIRVFTMNSALLYRVGIYTSAFQTIAIPELVSGIKSEENRLLITVGLLFMYIGMWWYEIYYSGSLNHFTWIWQR